MKRIKSVAGLFFSCVLFIQNTGCQSSQTMRYSREVVPDSPAMRPSAPSIDGLWKGVCADESVSIRFGLGGALIFSNAHESLSGSWRGSGRQFSLRVGESEGTFVLIDSSTASLSLDGAHAEMKKTR
jgi:hypothetical protein